MSFVHIQRQKSLIKLFLVSLVASIYIILSIAVERYLAVCRPHQYREMMVGSCFVNHAKTFSLDVYLFSFQSWKNRSLVYILPVLLFSFLINIPKWKEIGSASHCYDYSHCFGRPFIYTL